MNGSAHQPNRSYAQVLKEGKMDKANNVNKTSKAKKVDKVNKANKVSRREIYDAAYFKGVAVAVTDNTPLSSIVAVIRDSVFTEQETIMDQPSRRVGNEEGLSILDRLDKNTQEVASLKQEIADHKRRLDDHDEKWLLIHASELEKVNNNLNMAARIERNQIIHGCDVLLSLKALHFLQRVNITRFESASQGFFKLYRLKFEDEARISAAPVVIKETLNMRANVEHLKIWKGSPKSSELIRLCNGIVKKWQDSLKHGGVYPADTINQEYAQLCEKYNGTE